MPSPTRIPVKICGSARGQHDGREQLARARAQAEPCPHQIRVDVARAGQRIQHDRKKRGEEDDVDDLDVADAEPENAQGNPGQRRNRPNEFEQWIDHRAKSRRPTHREAERYAEYGRGADREQHAIQAIDDVRDQDAARIRSMAAEMTAVGGGSITSSCGLMRCPKMLTHSQTMTRATSSQSPEMRSSAAARPGRRAPSTPQARQRVRRGRSATPAVRDRALRP